MPYDKITVGVMMVEKIPILNISSFEIDVADLSMTLLTIHRQTFWKYDKKGWGKKKTHLIYHPEVLFHLKSVEGKQINVKKARLIFEDQSFLLGLKAKIINQSNDKLRIPPESEFPKGMRYPQIKDIPPNSIEYELYVYTPKSLSQVSMNWNNFIKVIEKKDSDHLREGQILKQNNEKKILKLKHQISDIEEKHSVELEAMWDKVHLAKQKANERAEKMIDSTFL